MMTFAICGVRLSVFLIFQKLKIFLDDIGFVGYAHHLMGNKNKLPHSLLPTNEQKVSGRFSRLLIVLGLICSFSSGAYASPARSGEKDVIVSLENISINGGKANQEGPSSEQAEHLVCYLFKKLQSRPGMSPKRIRLSDDEEKFLRKLEVSYDLSIPGIHEKENLFSQMLRQFNAKDLHCKDTGDKKECKDLSDTVGKLDHVIDEYNDEFLTNEYNKEFLEASCDDCVEVWQYGTCKIAAVSNSQQRWILP